MSLLFDTDPLLRVAGPRVASPREPSRGDAKDRSLQTQ